MPPTTAKCKHCGKVYTPAKNRATIARRTYCSAECIIAARGPEGLQRCKHCGKYMRLSGLYCSRKCMGAYRRMHGRDPSPKDELTTIVPPDYMELWNGLAKSAQFVPFP